MRDLIICGCYRSGTSITSLILSHHPQLLITDELWYYYKDKRKCHFDSKIKILSDKFPELGQRPFIPYNILGKRYREFLDLMLEQIPDINKDYFVEKLIEFSGRTAKYYGDKLPEYVFELNNLTQIHNDPKVIMCVRDPRDIICSQIRRFKQYTEQFGSTLNHWWCKETVEECITMPRNWLVYMESWESFKGQVDGYVLKYHSLTSDPRAEGKNLSNFLGIEEKPMVATILDKFKPYNYGEWYKVDPDMTSKLPESWIGKMKKYGVKI